MYHVVDFMTAANISVARLGPSAMLVVQSRNLSSDSFELMKGGQVLWDPQATQDLFDKLQALRAKHPHRTRSIQDSPGGGILLIHDHGHPHLHKALERERVPVGQPEAAVGFRAAIFSGSGVPWIP